MGFDFAKLAGYDTIVDVRSPAEYALDHVPGAVNWPVLDDAQRHEVGSLYQRDQLQARRIGMGYVAAALAGMAASRFGDRPASWRPLVYCWRGGMRSGVVGDALRKVGWQAEVIEGGYKAYRAHVRELLATLPARLRLRVLGGPTGAGKTALLAAIASAGGATLDLEGLANHRGSLFGDCGAQPSQKGFESALARRLGQLVAQAPAPVFVEAESRRIGRLEVPAALLARMRAAEVVVVEASLARRAAFTARTYPAFRDGARFAQVLAQLARLRGASQVGRWRRLHREGAYEALAASLLELHYDPKYARSLERNFRGRVAATVEQDPLEPASLAAAAAELLGAS